MNLYIKNMVSERCKIIVKSELEKFGLHYIRVELGEVEIEDCMTAEELKSLNEALKVSGFSLLTDHKSILIEKIKNNIIEMVHYSEKPLQVNFSIYLSEKLKYNYTYLANLFSENQGMTIEHFLLNHRIERVKELLIYDELNITEIAFKMHYSSVAHLSKQFKKMTGLTPSQYNHLRIKNRIPLENM